MNLKLDRPELIINGFDQMIGFGAVINNLKPKSQYGLLFHFSFIIILQHGAHCLFEFNPNLELVYLTIYIDILT